MQAKWRDLAAASESRVASRSPAWPNIPTRLPSGSEGLQGGALFIANDQTDKCSELTGVIGNMQAVIDKTT